MLDFKPIRVSAKWSRIKFLTCGPECFEKKGCHGLCCDPPSSSKGGPRVYVTPDEAINLHKKYKVKTTKDGFLIPEKGCKLCPFKGKTYECNIHFTPNKPIGCIVSPFALNKNNTLIIRHRYIHLPCRDDSGKPAYKAFRDSLVKIFGRKQTNKLWEHLDAGGGDLTLRMDNKVYNDITEREVSLGRKYND